MSYFTCYKTYCDRLHAIHQSTGEVVQIEPPQENDDYLNCYSIYLDGAEKLNWYNIKSPAACDKYDQAYKAYMCFCMQINRDFEPPKLCPNYTEYQSAYMIYAAHISTANKLVPPEV